MKMWCSGCVFASGNPKIKCLLHPCCKKFCFCNEQCLEAHQKSVKVSQKRIERLSSKKIKPLLPLLQDLGLCINVSKLIYDYQVPPELRRVNFGNSPSFVPPPLRVERISSCCSLWHVYPSPLRVCQNIILGLEDSWSRGEQKTEDTYFQNLVQEGHSLFSIYIVETCDHFRSYFSVPYSLVLRSKIRAWATYTVSQDYFIFLVHGVLFLYWKDELMKSKIPEKPLAPCWSQTIHAANTTSENHYQIAMDHDKLVFFRSIYSPINMKKPIQIWQIVN